jgi:hypothetical protein
MNHNDAFLRNVLVSGLEPSDELRDRFERSASTGLRQLRYEISVAW